jgi:hypothetical protein
MNIERHNLVNDVPEHKEAIHELKMNDRHFAKLFNEYHEVDDEIIRIEDGVENTSDEYLESLKYKRLNLKDEMIAMIHKHKAA